MSLHLGNDFAISSKQIVSILNLHHLSKDSILYAFLFEGALERRRKIGTGPYRSAVVCKKGTVYLSPLDASTLARRFKTQSFV
jgi:hypothetical protein